MGRSPCCDKSAVKRGPWSAEEDARLRSYMERHGGGGSWLALPRKAGLRRCGKSCRLRWLNYLRPGLRRGGFTPEEDRLICALYAAVGSRWSFIAAHLPGRTDNGVKNYWNTRLKKKLFAGGRRGGHRHDDANAGNVEDAPPPPPLPLPPAGCSSQPYAYGAMGCVGDGGDVLHMHVDAGGVFTDMITGTNAAAVNQYVDNSYSSVPAATSELDEIFRSIGTRGGEHSDLSQSSSTDMVALNWNHFPSQQSVPQNHLGIPDLYRLCN